MEPTQTTPVTPSPRLETIVSDVLGDLAFLVSDIDPPQPASRAQWLHCSISYRGPSAGTLECWCTRSFAVQLAANLLGLEPDDEEARTRSDDALREFMNVTCGQLITAWHGKDAVFELTIPAVHQRAPAPERGGQSGDWRCELYVDGEPFVCAYRKDG